MEIYGFPEEAGDACSDLGTDVPDGLQRFNRGGCQGIEGDVGVGEAFRRLFSDMPDACGRRSGGREEVFFARPIAVREIRRRLVCSPLQSEEFFLCEEEDVGRIADQTARNELSNHFFPQSSISSAPRRNGRYAASEPDRLPDAAMGRFALAHHAELHSGQVSGMTKGLSAPVLKVLTTSTTFGNDVSGPLILTVSPVRISLRSISS